ncbi:hypothetical protein SAMN02745219_01276 [Desulfofundulus thermosubterraneus DSM 16057]|uniref:Uncharacterized protein n=2 Tax=Desulfofundulus TaxID=2282741 RepID=A0A1M6EU10_9FIRM|nr:hypothetical protein SAMN02745219_01276 [Desulfofundulus thermosubterraneus DSM 16057]
MEAKREVAATGEQSPEVPPHWFLYLMERSDWRVTFRYRFDRKEVRIAEVVHRSKAYRG